MSIYTRDYHTNINKNSWKDDTYVCVYENINEYSSR